MFIIMLIHFHLIYFYFFLICITAKHDHTLAVKGEQPRAPDEFPGAMGACGMLPAHPCHCALPVRGEEEVTNIVLKKEIPHLLLMTES